MTITLIQWLFLGWAVILLVWFGVKWFKFKKEYHGSDPGE